jgi:hypothetical protein
VVVGLFGSEQSPLAVDPIVRDGAMGEFASGFNMKTEYSLRQRHNRSAISRPIEWEDLPLLYTEFDEVRIARKLALLQRCLSQASSLVLATQSAQNGQNATVVEAWSIVELQRIASNLSDPPRDDASEQDQ